MEKSDQLEILRHWVREANNAHVDIAFIDAFEETRAGYVDKKAGDTLSNPIYNPFGRVAIRRLHATTDTLVLFCRKAMEHHSQSCNVRELKNYICMGEHAPGGQARCDIDDEFKSFNGRNRSIEAIVKDLRDKVVAHSDSNIILEHERLTATNGDVTQYAKDVVKLIQALAMNSGLREVGTVEDPISTDNLLNVRPIKLANGDALEFWRSNFSQWAK